MKKIVGLFCLVLLPLWVTATVPPGYYDQADGLKKTELKAAMKTIVSKVSKMLTYGSGAGKTWTGFYTTDRYDGLCVRDRYSNDVHRFSSSDSKTAASAVTGMNIEHSFPKSWWGGSSNNAYKDLFNLMPCESSINSSKSNYAMGVVTTVKKDNGCTKVGTGKAGNINASLWEPADKWKGDFARGYFYMVTAYSGLPWEGEAMKMLEKNEWPTLQTWAQELLLKWSKEDPVDEIETERNEAVYAIQGNRNPFVDYPNLAEYIWGDSIDFAFYVDGQPQTGGEDEDDDDTGGGTVEPGEEDMPLDTEMAYNIDFTKSDEGWTVDNKVLPSGVTNVWQRDSRYGMKASAYVNSVAYAAESWLISPTFDLTECTTAELTFSHTGKFFGQMAQEASVLVSADDGETWQRQEVSTWMTGDDWVYVNNTMDLSQYAGERIRIAFCYKSSEADAPTWEVKSVTVKGEGHWTLADVDGNGQVELADTDRLLEMLLGRANATVGADVNGDGRVSIEDLVRLIGKLHNRR